MIKRKNCRIIVTLECTECRINAASNSYNISRYITQKNRRNTINRLELKKYCRYCNQATNHKEIK